MLNHLAAISNPKKEKPKKAGESFINCSANKIFSFFLDNFETVRKFFSSRPETEKLAGSDKKFFPSSTLIKVTFFLYIDKI